MQYCLNRKTRLCTLAEGLEGVNVLPCSQDEEASTNVMDFWSAAAGLGTTHIWTTSIGDCQPGQVQTLAAADVASKRGSLGGSCTSMTSAAAAVRCCADYRY